MTIASQIESCAYQYIDELMADVHTASFSLEDKPDIHESDVSIGTSHHLSPPNSKPQSGQVVAFMMEVEALIRRAMVQDPRCIITKASERMLEEKDAHDDIKTSPLTVVENPGKKVLTLYGSAPHPRQLFSSLQMDSELVSSKSCQTSDLDFIGDDQAFNLAPSSVTSSLQESALPNGISTTKVIPVHNAGNKDEKANVPTFGDLFAPPASVPPLNPPKQSRHTATRSQSVNWYTPAEVSAPIRTRGRESYTTQPLSTGHWLTYNVAPSPAQLSSPGEKRKQRDRALSIGETKPSLPEETLLAYQQAKEDALFKSVYSSFAPDHDDAAALVPQELKNKLWWKRVGEKKYRRVMGLDAIAEKSGESIESNETLQLSNLDEDELFKDAVESFEPEEPPPEFVLNKQSVDSENVTMDKDTAEILEEISGLLETLNSYQRVRNLSLAANARTSAGQNPQLTALSGSPASPSSAEFDTYELLKSHLTLMISTLPPYAVAKLNGDQLGFLNISTKIQREGRKSNGTMEDHDYATKVRPPLISATSSSSVRPAAQIATSARTGSYQQPLGTPVQRNSYTSGVRPAAPSATYPSHQYSARSTTTAQYGTYSTQQASNAVRHSYQPHQYGAQTSQAQASQYANGTRPFPTQNGYTSYGQQYAATPPATSSGTMLGSQYQRPSQPGYQQRAQNSLTPGYGSAPSARSASPQNPASTYNPQTPSRSSYTSSTVNQSLPRPHYHPSSSTPTSSLNNNAVQANAVATTIGQTLNLSAEEQALLVKRNKDYIAGHVTMGTLRQGSGTPQPNNGPNGVQSNGTGLPQQNGIAAGSGS